MGCCVGLGFSGLDQVRYRSMSVESRLCCLLTLRRNIVARTTTRRKNNLPQRGSEGLGARIQSRCFGRREDFYPSRRRGRRQERASGTALVANSVASVNTSGLQAGKFSQALRFNFGDADNRRPGRTRSQTTVRSAALEIGTRSDERELGVVKRRRACELGLVHLLQNRRSKAISFVPA